MPIYDRASGKEYVAHILEDTGVRNKKYDTDLDGLIDELASHTHTRDEITDLWNSPFWGNIPDKPSFFSPKIFAKKRFIFKLPDLSSGYTIIREAEADSSGYWVGAPYVFYDPETGEFWMTYRWRNPDNRGYKSVIAKSTDGINFTDYKEILKGDLGANSLEKGCLVRDPITGKYRYYICFDDGTGWDIWKLDDVDDPANLDPSTKTKVLARGASGEWDDKYAKDPAVFYYGGLWLMLYVGENDANDVEQSGLAYSPDGVNWTKYSNNPIIEVGSSGAWDDRYAKVTTMLQFFNAWLLIYSGRYKATEGATDQDWSQGLAVWIPQIGSKPVKITKDNYLSGTYSTEYLDIVIVDEDVYIYYQKINSDLSMDLVVKKVKLSDIITIV